MSKENAMKFLEELSISEALQTDLNEIEPTSSEGLISIAEKRGFHFTIVELNEILVEIGAIELSDETLENVSAGAFPTAVNNQITDSVFHVNTKVLGDSPAIALGNLYVATAQALSNAAHNATSAQQQSYVTMQAANTQGISTLYGIDTASTGEATRSIY